MREPGPILIVEDSPEDYEMVLLALRAAGCPNPVIHCQDGDSALSYLRPSEEQDLEDLRPRLVVLDLNMPGMDGRELLGEIRADRRLCSIPIIVLTTSSDERDVDSCYRAGANCYLQKPFDLKDLNQTMRLLKEFWLDTALLPRDASA